MLGPSLILLALFFFYPLVYAAWLSLFEWDLLMPARFVGTRNYVELAQSGELTTVLTNTLLFSATTVVGSVGLGLGLAVALNRPGRVPAFVRSAVFSAYVVSWVSVALLWLWVLDRDDGLLNVLLRGLGLASVDWLGDPDVALWSIALVTIWKVTGYAMVLFLAGLQDIPKNLYEAAALDGAGPLRQFVHVTWPGLLPTTAFVSTTSLIASFQVFDVVRVMTQGGPVQSTTVFVYAIYEQVFENLRVGRASAEVVVFFGVLMLLTVFQLWLFRRQESPSSARG